MKPKGKSYVPQTTLDSLARVPLPALALRIAMKVLWQQHAFPADKGAPRPYALEELADGCSASYSKTCEAVQVLRRHRVIPPATSRGRIRNLFAIQPPALWIFGKQGTVNSSPARDGKQSPRGGRNSPHVGDGSLQPSIEERRTSGEEPIKNQSKNHGPFQTNGHDDRRCWQWLRDHGARDDLALAVLAEVRTEALAKTDGQLRSLDAFALRPPEPGVVHLLEETWIRTRERLYDADKRRELKDDGRGLAAVMARITAGEEPQGVSLVTVSPATDLLSSLT